MPIIMPNTAPIIDPPRTPIIQSKNSFEELFLLIYYNHKKQAIIMMPIIPPIIKPQTSPGITVLVTISSISFFKLISKV